jgi:hypothetical protein
MRIQIARIPRHQRLGIAARKPRIARFQGHHGRLSQLLRAQAGLCLRPQCNDTAKTGRRNDQAKLADHGYCRASR